MGDGNSAAGRQNSVVEAPVEANNKFLSYEQNVEIFMALWDVDFYYSSKENRFLRRISSKRVAITVIGFWKPPGALQWVEKCVTETVFKEKSPSFAMKMNLQYEAQDADSIALKFEIRDMSVKYVERVRAVNTIGVAETTLGTLLTCKSKGLVIQVPPFYYSTEEEFTDDRIEPGQCFLRAEVLKPDFNDKAMLLQFGLSKAGSKKCSSRYYFEILKINEATRFELPQPYTLIHRSETSEPEADSPYRYWHPIVTPLAKLCNGDMERVLKLVLYDAEKPVGVLGSVPIGFAVTTLRKLLIEKENVLAIVQTKDGKVSRRLSFVVKTCSELNLSPIEEYFSRGLILRRIFAVDYSTSNWNQALHRRSLHESVAGTSPYLEALQLTAKYISGIMAGDSVFYSFGNPKMNPFVASFEQEYYLEALLENYNTGLLAAKMASMELSDGDHRGYNCMPVSSSKFWNKKSTLLTPLLNDLMALLTVREGKSEYYVAFIFTDGEIADLEDAMDVMIQLSKLPMSLVFIAVGLGDLAPLLRIQRDWVHPTTHRYPCRRLTNLIHFRSLLDWNSSIQFAACFKTSSEILFAKELHNGIQKQVLKYMRMI